MASASGGIVVTDVVGVLRAMTLLVSCAAGVTGNGWSSLITVTNSYLRSQSLLQLYRRDLAD